MEQHTKEIDNLTLGMAAIKKRLTEIDTHNWKQSIAKFEKHINNHTWQQGIAKLEKHINEVEVLKQGMAKLILEFQDLKAHYYEKFYKDDGGGVDPWPP